MFLKYDFILITLFSKLYLLEIDIPLSLNLLFFIFILSSLI